MSRPVREGGCFSWLIYTWALCASAPPDSNLIPAPQLPPTSPPPISLHPLLHHISLSPSIQIVFIGVTGPVVGDSQRRARTMHCDGDIHMIMSSDLILLQIHLNGPGSPFLSFLSLSVSLPICLDVCDCSVDFINDF